MSTGGEATAPPDFELGGGGGGSRFNPWILVYIGAFVVALLAGWVYWHTQALDSHVVGAFAPEDRLELIAQNWRAEPRTKTGGCPMVSALEKAAPELRGVDARERDYVAFLRGKDC